MLFKTPSFIIVLLLFHACTLPQEPDRIASIYLSLALSDDGLQKSYFLDGQRLITTLSWPNLETGKSQQLKRVDSLPQAATASLYQQLNEALQELPETWSKDSLLSCKSCRSSAIHFRLQTQIHGAFRLEIPRDYPKDSLPTAIRSSYRVFLEFARREEAKNGVLQ